MKQNFDQEEMPFFIPLNPEVEMYANGLMCLNRVKKRIYGLIKRSKYLKSNKNEFQEKRTAIHSLFIAWK